MAAAVADFRPTEPANGKLKKAGRERLRLELEADPGRARRRWLPRGAPGRRSWGSPPSTASGAIEYGRGKLREKALDAVVVNDISRSDIGIGAERNEVAILTAAGEQHVPRAAKAEVAAAILDAVERLRARPPAAHSE